MPKVYYLCTRLNKGAFPTCLKSKNMSVNIKKKLGNKLYRKFRDEKLYSLLLSCEDPGTTCQDLEVFYRSRNYYVTNAVVKFSCCGITFKVMKVIFNHPFDKSKSFILKYHLK